jgi:hypothetical protein
MSAIGIGAAIAGAIPSLKDAIQEYQKKREEKERLNTQLADSLQLVIKEYEFVTNEMAEFDAKALDIFHGFDEKPNLNLLHKFLDCSLQIPKLLTENITLLIHLARTCRDIEKNKGFMSSLQTNNRFTYDFIDRMGDTYVEKDRMVVNSSFFQFVLMYRSEIERNLKLPDFDKKEIEFLRKQTKAIQEGLQQRTMRHYIEKEIKRKWMKAFAQFNKAAERMKIDAEGMDLSFLNDFMPSGLRELTDFLNKPPR